MIREVVDQATVVIIGGGIIGCSAAWHLARAGVTDVLVLERNQLCTGATARAAGLVCHGRSDVPTIQMVNRTRAAIAELEDMLAESLDFRQVGSIRAIFAEAREGELRAMEECVSAAGLQYQDLSASDARKLCPWLDLDAAWRIVFLAADGYVDGARLGMAYAAAARRLGVRIRRGITATGLIRTGHRVTGVETDQGTIRAEWVVDAAGAWGAEVASWLGWGVAAAPTRSQYWITAPDGSGAPGQPNVHLPDVRTYVRSEVGGLVIGMQEPSSPTFDPMQLPPSMDDVPLSDDEQDLGFLLEHANALRSIMPSIDTWGFAHHVTGLSNYTPDGKFLVGTVPGIEQFVVAGGCCGAGIAASGGFGQVVSDLVAGHDATIDISRYRPERFGFVDPSSEAFRERCAAARAAKSRGLAEAFR